MSDFRNSISFVFKREGGYSDRKNDLGGPTNYGISLRFLKTLGKFGDFDGDGDIDIDDIKLLDQEKAGTIYRKEFWDAGGYGRIEDNSIALKVFDMAVNMGARRSHLILQEAINFLNNSQDIKVDGVLGPQTLKAVNAAEPKYLLACIKGLAVCFYLDIVKKNHTQLENLGGWLNRALT